MEKKEGQPQMYNTFALVKTSDAYTQAELSAFILPIRQLYTRWFLISQVRFGDLKTYTDTGNSDFDNESGLNIKTNFDISDLEAKIPKGTEIEFQSLLTANPRVNNAVAAALPTLWENPNPKLTI